MGAKSAKKRRTSCAVLRCPRLPRFLRPTVPRVILRGTLDSAKSADEHHRNAGTKLTQRFAGLRRSATEKDTQKKPESMPKGILKGTQKPVKKPELMPKRTLENLGLQKRTVPTKAAVAPVKLGQEEATPCKRSVP
jgi:hypothetical protein